jgi:hypothetical protein
VNCIRHVTVGNDEAYHAIMRKPSSVRSLEALGRVRLLPSFYMRGFLYSEIANLREIPNLPDNPEISVAAGRRLCKEFLEPLQAKFGRLAIRSTYRSCALNTFGNPHRLSCASNPRDYARHIKDRRGAKECIGAMTTVFVPWFAVGDAEGADWQAVAW